MSNDAVNHPAHYTFGTLEVIDVIEAWNLNYHVGNAVKYLARAGRKGPRLEDLRKAHWYLDREVTRGNKRMQMVPRPYHPKLTLVSVLGDWHLGEDESIALAGIYLGQIEEACNHLEHMISEVSRGG